MSNKGKKMKEKKVEFSDSRSQLYKKAMDRFPLARVEDLKNMKKYLNPQKNEMGLEVGAGGGFFTAHLVELSRKITVVDPSEYQLQNINLKINKIIGDEKDLKQIPGKSLDFVWSFGALHHSFNKTDYFKEFSRILKDDGRVVIGDVWQGSKLAKHFDGPVAKYCETGHEVAFWSNEMTESLAFINSFSLEIIDTPIKWVFDKKEDIGEFLYGLHAMTKTSQHRVLRDAEKILGIEEKNGQFLLNWPMKIIILKKK